MPDLDVLKPTAFQDLVKRSEITSARIEADDQGLFVIGKSPSNKLEKILGSTRGGRRIFKSIDGAASVLQSYGITDFDCNLANWIPQTVVRGYKHFDKRVA